MIVWYVHKDTTGGVTQAANILWKGKWPMRDGEYPSEHPCVANAAAFERFRGRGYWANPSPRGTASPST
jgi:hypothetical protein